MQYQLPSGKVIHLSIEDYLAMSDQDLKDLEATNLGEYASSPWEGSAIKQHTKPKEKSEIDKSIDFKEDSDEMEPPRILSSTMTILTVDEIPPSDEGDVSEEVEET